MVGTVDVDGMLAEMPSGLFDEWRAYSLLDPFGTEATFFSAAQIASAVLNTSRKKGTRAISPADIVPDFIKSARRALGQHGKVIQTPEQQLAIAELLNMRFGGRDLRGDNG